jgi:endopeptidase La
MSDNKRKRHINSIHDDNGGNDSSDDDNMDDQNDTVNYHNNTLLAISYFKKLNDLHKTDSNYIKLDKFRESLDELKNNIFKSNSSNSVKKRKLFKTVIYKKIRHDFNEYEQVLNYLNDKFNENIDFSIEEALNYLEISDFFSNTPNPLLSLFGGFEQNVQPVFVIKSGKQKLNNNSKNADNNYSIAEFKRLCNYDTTELSSDDYFAKQSDDDQKKIIDTLRNIRTNDNTTIPNAIKVINYNMDSKNKDIILSKLNHLDELNPGASEYFKLKNWVNKIMKVPFGKYIQPPVTNTSTTTDIINYLNKVRVDFDTDIYGHTETKNQIIKLIAQTISNPKEGGNVFALVGPPGVGKTEIIHNGIAKALGRPYAFIGLGGATDASYLNGHNYTYEGSTSGKFVEILTQTGCMNPVIYLDELDKVSETAKGEEIINILMHITDATQNNHFTDRFFSGIDFDFSKAIIIFSFNDSSKVSRILKDRMKIIKVGGYKLDDKIQIAKKHLLPKLFNSVGIDYVNFSDDIIKFIIDTYTNEGGVRKLKEILSDILLELNLRKLSGNLLNYQNDQININIELLEKDILKTKHKITHLTIPTNPQIGVVNGLWANSFCVGGLIPIECCWIPSSNRFNLELTGMQGQVMKESMMVSKSVCWKILPNKIKKSLSRKKDLTGIHIHCPDGSTPKDGPSAGGAITTCLVSLLSDTPVRNDVAMTGEINLKGQITAIGGLEEKMFGAKKAGAKVVLCPIENSKDLDDIIVKFPNMITLCENKSYPIEKISDDRLCVIKVDNILDVLNIALVENNLKFNEIYIDHNILY